MKMRSLKTLAAILSAVSAFALQLPKSPSIATGTVQTVPSITFSSIGTVGSLQMNGTATWSYGSDQETGTVRLLPNANGQSTMTLQLDSGVRVETQNAFSEAHRQCGWTGPDAVSRSAPLHQCWLDTIWFLPQITMQTGVGTADDVVSVVPSVLQNAVRIHHERHPLSAEIVGPGELFAHLSAVDLDIDSTTHLPIQLSFATHPDSNADVDLPVEVHYSAYNTFGGVTVPTHIQKFINHTLVLDLQITDVQVQPASSAPIPSPSTF
jgi:hypothetical protein